MHDWRTFDDPRFELQFRYPAVTPGGEPIAVTEDQVGDAVRIHLRSASGEVYVELVRLPPVTAADEYRTHRPALERCFGPGAVSVLTETRVGSRPAWAYTFAWPAGERAALLLRTTTATYRAILDTLALHERI
jgi:hypothetical protein